MYYKVYIDVVFVTNLLMDYILLQAVGRFFYCRGSKRRCLLAAATGALFSCFILYVPTGGFLPVRILLHGACAFLMTALGCGLKRNGLLAKAMASLYLTAFFAGGLWEAYAGRKAMGAGRFLLLAGGTWLCLSGLSALSDSLRTGRKNIYPITLACRGKVQSFYGFYDTGNILADPVNGEPVSIVKPEILEAMLSKETADRLKHLKENPGELESTELAGLHPRFLPYQTIGGQGVLLAVTLEDLMIHTPREVVHIDRPVFALSQEPSALGKEYKVLLNSKLLH